jgi:glycosyltransferase involved in cell wall biosynthesis
MGHIGWMVTYEGDSGGNWVRDQVIEGAPERHTIDQIVNEVTLDRNLPRSLYKTATHDDPDIDLWVENPTSVAVRMPTRRERRLGVLQGHVRTSYRSVGAALQTIESQLVFRRLREVDRVVVVSDYLKRYLRENGVTADIEVVYNGLPIARFEFDRSSVEATRKQLCENPETPLIHVGMWNPDKGGKRVYERLKHMDAEFVTTGRTSRDVPITHRYPDYDDYLRLLAACDVFVAMSEYREGWCLQVQEAMLCRTPVVGSGRGGMEMLLEGGEQLVCEDYDDLESLVRYAIDNGEELGNKGYAYGSQFTQERMVEGWIDLFDDLL